MMIVNLLNDQNYFKKLFRKKKIDSPADPKDQEPQTNNNIDQYQKNESQKDSASSLQEQEEKQQQNGSQGIQIVIKGDSGDQPHYQDPLDHHLSVEKHIFTQQNKSCPAMRYGLKSWILYYVIFIGVTIGGPGLLINAQYKNYYIKIKDDDSFLTTVGIIASLANGLLRSIWGFIADKFTPKQILTFMGIVNVGLMASIDYVSEN